MIEAKDRSSEDEKQKGKEIIDRLWKKLPEFAKKIIGETQDMSSDWDRDFLDKPDNAEAHKPNWHQWGIISHTKMFEMIHRKQVPSYLHKWGLEDKIAGLSQEKIDGLTKDELIRIAILFHDLGKFSSRTSDTRENGTHKNSFEKHEEVSGRIIRSPGFHKMLQEEYGLTPDQIEYVAKCAEKHYELAKLRDEAKKSEENYTLKFARSEECKKQCRQIMKEHPGFEREIGILFLGDSLAKTDLHMDVQNDSDIERQKPEMERIIKERKLNSKLINCVTQLPVNIETVKTYMSEL